MSCSEPSGGEGNFSIRLIKGLSGRREKVCLASLRMEAISLFISGGTVTTFSEKKRIASELQSKETINTLAGFSSADRE